MNQIETQELIYEYTVKITQMVEFGFPFEALMAGKMPPSEGARFDVFFEGTATGTKLAGRVVGVDHLYVRGDGRMELHIHATLTTDTGQNVALFADGVCLLRPAGPVADLRENVTLFTSSEKYAWVNSQQIWATGTVDLAEQVIQIQGYTA